MGKKWNKEHKEYRLEKGWFEEVKRGIPLKDCTYNETQELGN